MKTYVLVPGAWAGAWIWEAVAVGLREKGHKVHAVTLAGLRPEDSARDVTLATHVQDVLDVLKDEQIHNAILVGHSYSGLVVGQVAAQMPEAVAHTVFSEAFLPVQGQSFLDVAGLDAVAEERRITENGGLWPPPTRQELEQQRELSAEQIDQLAHRLLKQPGRTLTDTADLAIPLARLRATLIFSDAWRAHNDQADLVDALVGQHGWQLQTLNKGHWPMLTAPAELCSRLLRIEI